MNKKKPLIISCCAGAAAASVGFYHLMKSIYHGCDFLDSYVKRCKEDFVPGVPKTSLQMEEDGYYALIKTDHKPFRILQLTDLHIGGGYLSRHEDLRALSIMRRVIRSTRPDLIVLTGDLVCPRAHISMTRNNLHAFRIITDVLESTEIPYAVVFGNHDADGKATHKRREIADFLMTRKHSLLVETDETQNITGFSNYIIKLRDSSERLDAVLFLVDSNEYIRKDQKKVYDYIEDDQVKWYENVTRRINEEEKRKVPSFVFMHMPLKQYEEAWDAAVNAKKTAVFYYGSKNEKISTQSENCKLYDKIKELDSTKGIFFVLYHLNDFSVEYEGVRFTYGQGIDCLLYAKNFAQNKGGTLLTIHKDGSFEIKGKKHR